MRSHWQKRETDGGKPLEFGGVVVTLEDLFLTKVLRVSQGTLQPVLALRAD